MKALLIALLIGTFLFQHTGVCQRAETGCNEKPDSPTKLFVFIGELLQANAVPARLNVNEARFVAKYRIIERICGYYPPADTINFDVIQIEYDSGFMKNKYQLLMLTKDTAEGEKYVLWLDLYFDVLKTANQRWAVCYSSKNQGSHVRQPDLKPVKTRFSRNAFFDTKGMTVEAVDVNYPEPYFKIKKNKAIPLFGNSIGEVFQQQKNVTLGYWGVYDRVELPADPDQKEVVVQDVEIEEVSEREEDSINTKNEIAYLAIKDSLARSPFNKPLIEQLIKNCRARNNFDNCFAFFDDLIRDYPDSVQAYLLKATFVYPRVTPEDSTLIGILQQALKVDSLNYEANYVMGLSYYRYFREQPNGYHAQSARKYFIRCIKIDRTKLFELRYTIIQLSTYLNDSNSLRFYSGLAKPGDFDDLPGSSTINQKPYIPIAVFMADTSKWVHDCHLDVMHQLRFVKREIDDFSSTMISFNEPILGEVTDKTVYRFSWFRSFDMPVMIRVEKNKRQATIYWKMLRYSDSLENYLPPVEMKKNIRLSQWKKFEKSLRRIDYWNMPANDPWGIGLHSASWILEASINGKYHYTNRYSGNYLKYQSSLRYLIDLTELEITEDDIY